MLVIPQGAVHHLRYLRVESTLENYPRTFGPWVVHEFDQGKVADKDMGGMNT